MDKPHIFALAAETRFLLIKEQVPIKFNKEISAVQCERKTFRLISLSTPVSFSLDSLFKEGVLWYRFRPPLNLAGQSFKLLSSRRMTSRILSTLSCNDLHLFIWGFRINFFKGKKLVVVYIVLLIKF